VAGCAPDDRARRRAQDEPDWVEAFDVHPSCGPVGRPAQLAHVTWANVLSVLLVSFCMLPPAHEKSRPISSYTDRTALRVRNPSYHAPSRRRTKTRSHTCMSDGWTSRRKGQSRERGRGIFASMGTPQPS
jgi:hypothetical protein